MNARAVVKRANAAVRARIAAHVWCEHWKANAVLVIVSAVSMSVMLRQIFWFVLFAFPTDSYAVTIAAQAVSMTWWHFAGACGIAAWGGAARLLHELRASSANFSFVHATGHMFVSQFAGVLTYLMAIWWEWPWPFAMLVCGLAGWGGNKAITRLDDFIGKRVFGEDKH